MLHGDEASEAFLSEIVGAQPLPGVRHMNMESIYEYGSRAGFWRLWRMFARRSMPVTVFGVAMALERNPDAVAAMLEADWEIASHGLRWIDYQFETLEVERAHFEAAIDIHTRVTGTRPLGWYTGRTSPNTRDLVKADGGFLYDSDSYADDLPYWERGPPRGAPRRSVHPGRQRHALRHCPGVQLRRPVLRLSSRQLRHPVPGRRAEPEDDVGRAPLPARRTAGTGRGARPVSRLRRRTRCSVGGAASRHRTALARAPSDTLRGSS